MNMPAVQTENPFAQQRMPVAGNAAAETDQQRAIAETQAAMVVAKRFPRDERAAMDRILNACTRQSLAESALYSYSKGGTDVTGPSIRLAEAIAQSWGNFQFGVRELEQRNGESTVEAYAWDIETNTRQVKVFQVQHERHSRKGVTKLTDPREVYELVANQGARRLRACILGVIPGDVIDAAVVQCETTLKTKIDITPELIANIAEKFAGYGVTKDMIEKRIQRRMDVITPALVVNLRKIFNSIKDGMSSPADWFEGGSATAAAPRADTREPMPDEKFSVELPKWRDLIAKGKKKPDEIIASAESKNTLTDAQKALIRGDEPAAQQGQPE